MAGIHEEEVLGKAYDSRLMKRLLTYLHPYRVQVVIALIAIVLKAGADVLGPYLTKVAIDKYLASHTEAHSLLDRFLSPRPLTGIAQIAAMYIGILLFSFLLEFTQTYVMQWTGQKVMFDLRSQIFRHLQRLHIAFFDRNPVGRLVTRVTSDVDALNEMFTAGVVSIFEDIFVLLGILVIMLNMSWRLALITFAVLPLIFYATSIFRRKVRESYRRIRIAIARINAYLQEHVTGIVVLQLFNREKKSYERFEKINRTHMDAFKDAIMAHAVYYPVVEVLSATAIACVVWFGGGYVIQQPGHARRAGGLHAVRAALLPAYPGPEREVQHPAIGHGVERARLQAARHPGRDRVARRAQSSRWTGPHRVRPRVVRLSNSGASRRRGRQQGREAQDRRRQRRSRAGNTTGCCATCPSPSSRARPSPSSATPAPARPRSSPCSCASTTCRRARSASMAWTSATWT